MNVNGKTLPEIFKEFREVKGNVKKKGGRKGFDYIPIEEYYSAFEKVVGCKNYTVEYSDLTYVSVKSGQDMFTVKCRITLLDDDGKPVIFKEGYGGSEFTYANETGNDSGLNNEPHTATTMAFKSAAKWFGVFGVYEGAETDGRTESSKKDRGAENRRTDVGDSKEKSPADAAQASKPKADDVKVALNTRDGFFVEKKDRSGKDIWKVRATLNSDNSECEIIFYPNRYGRDEETFLKLREMSEKKSVSLRIVATNCGIRNGLQQFIFKDYLPLVA